MNILIDIAHPAHVHLLRNFYKEMVARGHEVIVTVRDILVAKKLLEIFQIPYIQLGEKKDSLLRKGLDAFLYDWRMMQLVRKHKIEMGIGSSMTIAHVSCVTKMQSIVLDDDDDEVEPLFVKYAHPFADMILSPEGTPRASKKVIYYPAYHELAYLYPNRFTPDPAVLQELGIAPGEKYFLMRFNAFKAHHDVGISGLPIEYKRELIQKLSKVGRVFITTERNIDEEFKPYQLKVSPEKAHSLMYYATMFIGDSQTMTSEAAVLGVPSLRCNSFCGRIHYLEEEEHKYGLTYGFTPDRADELMRKCDDLLAMPNLKQEWQIRRQKMLSEKIDYAQFLTWFVENYPESKNTMTENPDYQWKFR